MSYSTKSSRAILAIALGIAITSLFTNSARAQTRIASTLAGGNWNATSTWTGGTIPSVSDTVEISTGSTVIFNNTTATTIALLDIAGTLNYSSTAASLTTNGDLTIFSGGVLNAYNGTVGKTLSIRGNFTNNGSSELSKAGTIITMGSSGSATSINGSGSFGVIRQLNIDNATGVTLSVPISISYTLNLQRGTLANGTNLTIDNTVVGTAGATSQCIIQRSQLSSLAQQYNLGTNASLYITYQHNSNGTAQSITEGYEMPLSRTFFRLTANNTAGINLTDDITLKSGITAMVLTAGAVYLPTGKTIICDHVSNTGVTGTATSFIDGAIAMAVGTTPSVKTFPIGSSGKNRKIILSGLAALTGTAIIRFEIKDTSSGTIGTGIGFISPPRRWSGTTLSGSFGQFSSVSLDFHQDDSLGASGISDGRVVNAGSIGGTYNSMGIGANTSSTITSAPGSYTSLAYFALGRYVAPPVTYYLSGDGNDTANGLSTVNAWRTLNKLTSATINSGDTILLKRNDTFPGTIRVSKSNVHINSYGVGEKPVIEGAEPIQTSWTINSGNIWETTFSANKPKSIGILLNGNNKLPLSRHPNKNSNNGYLNFEAFSGRTQITDNELDGSTNWAGTELMLRCAKFRLVKTKVVSQSGGILNLASNTETLDLANGYGYFFINDIKAIDIAGEWAYDSSAGKLYLYSDTDPNNIDIRFSRYDTLITISNATNVGLNNIQLRNAASLSISVKNSTETTIDSIDILRSGGTGIHISSSSYTTFINGSITDANWSGILSDAPSNYSTIKHNKIDKIGNETYGKSKVFIGIDCNSSNSNIENNIITRTGYAGIISAGLNILIKRNILDSVCLFLEDNGGIYTNNNINPAGTSGTIIEENIVTNSIGEKIGAPALSSQANGIYLDNGSQGVTVRNNTVGYINGSGYYAHSVQAGNKFIGNTSFRSGENELLILNPSVAPGFEINNNLFVSLRSGIMQDVIASKTSGYTLPQIGTFKNNYIVNPYNDSLVSIEYIDVKGKKARYNYLGWEASANEVHGTIPTPILYGNAADTIGKVLFFYNILPSNQTFSLSSGSFVDASNNAYCSSITVAPYSSTILFKADTTHCLTPSSCGEPSNFTADSLSERGLKLTWSPIGNNTDYDVKYKRKGTSEWKHAFNLKDTSVWLTKLEPSAKYETAVRASCYGAESNWVFLPEIEILPSYVFVNATIHNCTSDSAFGPKGVGTDNKWQVELPDSGTGSFDGDYIQSSSQTENCPPLTMTVNGVLDTCNIYDIYYYYVSPSTQSWVTLARLSTDTAMIQFDRNTPGAELLADYTGSTASNRLFRAKLGTVTGATGFSVIIDDYTSPGPTRSIFDGVSYIKVGDCNALAKNNKNGAATFKHNNQTQLSNVADKVYPNPSPGLFTINFANNEKRRQLQVFDLSGKLIYEQQAPIAGTYNINLKNHASGMYLLKVHTEKPASNFIKLVITK